MRNSILLSFFSFLVIQQPTWVWSQQTAGIETAAIGNINFKIPEGTTLTKAAEEPLIRWPVAADWDDDGNLVVVECHWDGSSVEDQLTSKPHKLVRLSDRDGDGVFDFVELIIGTDPVKADTDGDTISDGDEVWVFGYRADGTLLPFGAGDLLNTRSNDSAWVPRERLDFVNSPYRELYTSFDNPLLADLSSLYVWYVSDPRREDSDGDGLLDISELYSIEADVLGGLNLSDGVDLSDDASFSSMKPESRFVVSNPLNSDTNANGVTDLDEDYDNDYASNGLEVALSESDLIIPNSDADSLLDGIEVNVLGSAPNKDDTDSDGLNDDVEVLSAFVAPSVAGVSTNPRVVPDEGYCLGSEVALSVAGKSYCFTVEYRSYPTESDSDTDGSADNVDDYPLDPACADSDQGFNRDGRTCYSTWMAAQLNSGDVSAINSAAYKQIAISNPDWDSVIRYDYSAKKYLNDLDVSSALVDYVEYEQSTDALMLVSKDGTFSSVDLSSSPATPTPLTPLETTNGALEAMRVVDNHVLVQEGSGSTAKLAMYDLSGTFVDRLDLSGALLKYSVWSAADAKLFIPVGAVFIDDLVSISVEVGAGAGFIGTPQYAGANFVNLAVSSLSLDNTDTNTRIVIPSGYRVSADLSTVEALSDISILGAHYKSSAAQMIVKQSGVTERTDEIYTLSRFLDESALDQPSKQGTNSVQVFVDSSVSEPKTKNGFNFLARSDEQSIWSLLDLDNEIVQVSSDGRAVDFDIVGIKDYDSDSIPCFYEKKFGLVDSADCDSNVSTKLKIGKFEDADGDKLVNVEEYDNLTDPLSPDTDGDGWSDMDEVLELTDPLNALEF